MADMDTINRLIDIIGVSWWASDPKVLPAEVRGLAQEIRALDERAKALDKRIEAAGFSCGVHVVVTQVPFVRQESQG